MIYCRVEAEYLRDHFAGVLLWKISTTRPRQKLGPPRPSTATPTDVRACADSDRNVLRGIFSRRSGATAFSRAVEGQAVQWQAVAALWRRAGLPTLVCRLARQRLLDLLRAPADLCFKIWPKTIRRHFKTVITFCRY
jgi:hypothetical protein